MSILLGVIGSIQTAGGGGGGGSPAASWNTISPNPAQEGQNVTANISFTNWNNSTVYWTVVGSGNSYIGSQVTPYNGTINPGTGNNSVDINFAFNVDANADGNLTYYVILGSSAGQQDYLTSGPFTCRDSSQAHAMLLDLDPANYSPSSPNNWPDSSGNHYDCTIYNYGYVNATDSGISGGVMDFNGGTFTNINALATVNFGSLTASIWFKPTAVGGGSTQTLIAKEFVFKVRINSDGKIGVLASSDGSSWTTQVSTSGSENLTAGVWNNIILTVSDTDNIRLYLNGILCANLSQTILGYNTNELTVGMYNYNSSNGDFFTGLIGEVKLYNYDFQPSFIPLDFNSAASRYGVPLIPLSSTQNGTSGFIQITDNTSDWNMGKTWTIEFWSKAAASSTGNIFSILSQYTDANSGVNNGWNNIDIFYSNGLLGIANLYAGFPEPPPGVWTHVALVSDNGTVKGYYNGVQVWNYNNLNIDLTNGSDILYIGKRGARDIQYFNGFLNDIRISNTVVYTGAFTPPTSISVTTGTVLCLGHDHPYTDSTTRHAGSYSVTFSTENHKQVTGTLSDASGGTYGTVHYYFGNPKLLDGSLQSIPPGAQITSNLWSGLKTVTDSYQDVNGWVITYDATGMSGTTSTADSFSYFW